MASSDRRLEQFLRERIKPSLGGADYPADIKGARQVVEYLIRKYHCELKLDVFLGITGQHWVASFYSPSQCRRYEASGLSAPLAICCAAQEAILQLAS